MPWAKNVSFAAYVVAGLLLLGLSAPNAGAQEPEIQSATLKLGGQSCGEHVVDVEAALLHLRGVVMVDIEARKGHVLVGYDPSKVSVAHMLQAVQKKRGASWYCTAHLVAE
jgi:copper chaperone CopZ